MSNIVNLRQDLPEGPRGIMPTDGGSGGGGGVPETYTKGEIDAKLETINAKLDSISGRLESFKSDIDKSFTRGLTIASLVLALVSFVVSFLVTGFGVFMSYAMRPQQVTPSPIYIQVPVQATPPAKQ